MQRISQKDLQTPPGRGAISLVEALPEARYEAEHRPWAVNLPGDLTEEEELARSLAPDRPTTVVTHRAQPPFWGRFRAATEGSERVGETDVRVSEGGGEAGRVLAGLPPPPGTCITTTGVTARAA